MENFGYLIVRTVSCLSYTHISSQTFSSQFLHHGNLLVASLRDVFLLSSAVCAALRAQNHCLCHVFLLHSVQFTLPVSKRFFSHLVSTTFWFSSCPPLYPQPSQAISQLSISDCPGPHYFSSHLPFPSLFWNVIHSSSQCSALILLCM